MGMGGGGGGGLNERQVNERGRQGRERARIMREIRRQQAFEEKIAKMGGRASLTHDEAATRIQVCARAAPGTEGEERTAAEWRGGAGCAAPPPPPPPLRP